MVVSTTVGVARVNVCQEIGYAFLACQPDSPLAQRIGLMDAHPDPP